MLAKHNASKLRAQAREQASERQPAVPSICLQLALLTVCVCAIFPRVSPRLSPAFRPQSFREPFPESFPQSFPEDFPESFPTHPRPPPVCASV